VTRPLAFEFATTPLVLFGAGTVERLGEHAARHGRRAWLVTGAGALDRAGVVERAIANLAAAGVSVARQSVLGEPHTRTVDGGARDALASGCDLVIGMGGGSVLDTAKAVACLMGNGGEALDYLEGVGRGRPITRPSAPFLAVPTTAGTGSEATLNAVIADPASGTKASIRHASLLPRVALLDPVLTHSLPPEVTARTGLDALVQLIEPYVSKREHPMIDVLALDGLRRASAALPRAYADGADAAAREDLMLAALWSGMALAHCGLGAAHALAGPLGGSFPVPHGFACAATIAGAMAVNLRAADRAPNGAAIVRRYADVARAMGEAGRDSERALATAGVARVRSLCELLRVPKLSAFGVTREAIPGLAARARKTSSMKANPVDLTDADLAEILERAID
jgi:alcohol dehydrogenase class IV